MRLESDWPARKGHVSKPVLTRDLARAMRADFMRLPAKTRLVILARKYHCSASTVRAVLKREAWRGAEPA